MKTGHVYRNPHEELTMAQLGGLAEVFIKALLIKKGFVPKKLCEHDHEKKKHLLLIDDANWVIKNSNIGSDRKQQLMDYLKRKVYGPPHLILKNSLYGLPDFIVLTPDKKIIFAEVKYNGGRLEKHQQKRKEELEDMGFPVLVERMGKILPASQLRLDDIEKSIQKKGITYINTILNKLIFWRKPKLVTTHKIG